MRVPSRRFPRRVVVSQWGTAALTPFYGTCDSCGETVMPHRTCDVCAPSLDCALDGTPLLLVAE